MPAIAARFCCGRKTNASIFLATIASECSLTGINISTQVNSYPGQAPTLYLNSGATLQITLRKSPASP